MFRRVNADEVALRMVKSKVNFLSKRTVPCTHQRGNVDSRRAVQAVKDTSTGLSDRTRVRRWKRPDVERKGFSFFGIVCFWSASNWRDNGVLSL